MARFRGLTWDHPRGREALERSAAATDGLIEWYVHSLEGFESAPIDETAAQYDVIVLDHPHLGDAIATDSLRPLGEVFDSAWLESLVASSVGPSMASYLLDGEYWAVPLDAATQVAVLDPSRVRVEPQTWAEVAELSRTHSVALSLAGPHAYLTFVSLCVSLGEEPHTIPGEGVVSRATGIAALDILTDLASRMPDDTTELNPIGLLERMRGHRDIAYIPLVYGYVNYSAGDAPLRFVDAPALSVGGRRGSTIGGTGLAISRFANVDADLIRYLSWHLDPLTQATVIPDNAGQPSARSAWLNEHVNSASSDFFTGTLATIDGSWVRPRVAGFTPFQSEASALLRAAILGQADATATLATIDELFDGLAVSTDTRKDAS
ncbi:MAG: hypothetical protein ACOH19_12650 [Rhodoglobus sp.]